MNLPDKIPTGMPRPVDAADAVDADTSTPNSVNVDSVNGVHGELVHAYSRAQAIAEGMLVDVTRQAGPAEMHGGFAVPVAVTTALWAAIEAIPDSLAGVADPRGRLHDVLWMASLAARRQAGASCASFALFASFAGGQDREPSRDADSETSHTLLFAVHLPYRGTRKRVQTLRTEVGPDDDGAPCVTIGFPEDF